MATKAQQAEQTEALKRLRAWIKPGDTIHCVLRHLSRSGMLRVIDLLQVKDEHVFTFSSNAAQATGMTYTDEHGGGLKMTGCGMDMGFAAVYNLSSALFPDGFGCIGDKCPSNDHSNGDRDYTPHAQPTRCDCLDVPGKDGLGRVHKRCEGTGYVDTGNPQHWHRSGGYALRHRWL